MGQTELRGLADYERAVTTHPRLLLFKHSPRCPVSAAARREWDAFLATRPDVPGLFVDVIAERTVARGIAERCGVPHESPQAILFVDGVPEWHDSHEGVTEQALARAWATRGRELPPP